MCACVLCSGRGAPVPHQRPTESVLPLQVALYSDILSDTRIPTTSVQRLAVFRSSAEGKIIKHLSKYWGSSTQEDPCRSNMGGRDPCNPCGVDAYDHLLSTHQSIDR